MGSYNPKNKKDPDYCPCGIGKKRHEYLQQVGSSTAIQLITAREDPDLAWRLIETMPVSNDLESVQEAMTVMGVIAHELTGSVAELARQLDQAHGDPGGFDRNYKKAIAFMTQISEMGEQGK